MRRTRELPQWLVILLVLVAVYFLGPPVLGLLLGALGVAIGLTAVLIKLGLIALFIYAVFALLRAAFGKPKAATRQEQLGDSLDDNLDRLDRVDESRRALDRELERAIAAAQKQP